MLKSLFPFVLVASLGAQTPATFPAPLADRVPELAKVSSWSFDGTSETPAQDRGAFAIANGRVFAAAGIGPTANSLAGITGPDFGVAATAPGGAFGGLTFELVDANDRPLRLPRLAVRKLGNALFVATEDASDEVALRVTYFAPANDSRIVAAIDVAALGAPRDGLRLRATLRRGRAADGVVTATSADGAAHAVLRVAGAAPAGDDALEVALGALVPGTPWTGSAQLDTARSTPPARFAPDRDALVTLANATMAAWSERLADTTQYDTDDLRVRDLLADWKPTVLGMQCARSGAVVPMLGKRVASVRGQNGALLLMLRYRMFADARRILDLWWDAARATGSVAADVPIDVDWAARATERGTTDAAFWNSVTLAPGDIGSWIVLQHFWYWRATRDITLLEERWPLLEVCFKKQLRRDDVLMPFAGDEPWVAGLGGLDGELLGPNPELIGNAPELGRQADSFTSAVAFLVTVQAIGDIVDALDRARNPEKWQSGTPDPAPSSPYVRRAFALMAAIEKRFWQEDVGYFAPALGVFDGLPHREPVANANLFPLWVGWTYPTGERSRDNLRNALARLWLDGARVGTTRTLGVATGDVQGMLVHALAERDCIRRIAAVDAMLATAAPAGEWSTFQLANGRPLLGAGARLDPNVAGIDIDALLFAVLGVRQATYANWDDDDIRMEFRLPSRATWFAARGVEKDGHTTDMFFRTEVAKLSEEERRANDDLAPDRRRDPDRAYRRVKFVVELVRGNPPKGYYDVAINAEGTVFVRYLQPNAPDAPDRPDLRRIDEMEFATDDTLVFLPERSGPGAPLPPRSRTLPDGTELVALSFRNATANRLGAKTRCFDTGVPFAPEELSGLLLSDAGLRAPRLFLDWKYRAPRPAGFATSFWSSTAWTDLLERFRQRGGEVVEPGYVSRFVIDDTEHAADADGGLTLPPNGSVTIRAVVDAPRAAEAVLLFGTNAPLSFQLADQQGRLGGSTRAAEPDVFAQLVKVVAGANPVEIVVAPRPDGAARRLFVRLAGSDGLPLR